MPGARHLYAHSTQVNRLQSLDSLCCCAANIRWLNIHIHWRTAQTVNHLFSRFSVSLRVQTCNDIKQTLRWVNI